MADAKHTLYSKEIDEEKLEMEGGLFQITPKHTKYSLYLGDFRAEDSELNEIYNTLRDPKPKTLEIFIDSYGGLVDEGQRFQNIITNHFSNVDTYLDNKGYSMGALLFTFGDRRIVHEYSEIMFHNYSSGYYGKGHEVEARTKHDKKSLSKYFKSSLKPYFTKQEIKDMLNGKDFWMTSKEMLKRNIATHILINGELIEAKDYLKSLKGK